MCGIIIGEWLLSCKPHDAKAIDILYVPYIAQKVQIACTWAARGTNKFSYQTTQDWSLVTLHKQTYTQTIMPTRLCKAYRRSDYTHTFTLKQICLPDCKRFITGQTTHTQTHTHTHMQMRIHTHTHVIAHTHSNNSAYQTAQGWMLVRLNTHTQTNLPIPCHTRLISSQTTHAYVHTHTHTHTHTRKHTRNHIHANTRTTKSAYQAAQAWYQVRLHTHIQTSLPTRPHKAFHWSD